MLQFPAIFTDTGFTPGYSLKGWEWSNEKAKRSEVGDDENDDDDIYDGDDDNDDDD